MGIYYSQTLTVSGAQEDFAEFLDVCFKKEESGQLIAIDFERIAPSPERLPDGFSSGPLGFDVDVGVEAIGRAPRPRLVDGVDYGRPSVLESPIAKKLGLTDYDKLFIWIQKNRPETLAIGQAAIRAHTDIGSWSREEWQFDHWGESDLNGFEIRSLSDTTLVAEFYTKGLPVGPIVQAMGHKFPSLNFRLVALDDGDETPYIVRSEGGKFTEEYVEATDEFITEVEGQPREISDFYTKSAVLRPWPMTHIRFWPAERKVVNTLLDYPVYAPPFLGLSSSISTEQARANLEHFQNTRELRIHQLGRFLKKFNVALESSDIGLQQLDQWISKYAAFLAIRETGSSFLTHIPAWEGERLGQNVMFDLATFLGDPVIERLPGFYWELYRDVASGLRGNSELYQAIVIRTPNEDAPWRMWPFREVPQVCNALREKSFMWKKPSMTISPSDTVQKFASHFVAKAAEYASRQIN